MRTPSLVLGAVLRALGMCSRAIVKIILIVNWEGILMAGNALAGAISQAVYRLK